VPIHVRSSMTDVKGSMIMPEEPAMEAISVQGVTLKKDLAMVTLHGVPNTAGVAAHIFAEIGRNNILVDDIVQNIDNGGAVASLSFSTNASEANEARAVCERLAKEMGIRSVEIDEGLCKISAIGVGMRTHTGIAATMFDALAKAAVNIENISTSEIVISCIVRREDGPKALQHIHDAFGLDKKNGNGEVLP